MRIYTVEGAEPELGTLHHATKADAVSEARRMIRAHEELEGNLEVVRHETVPLTKENLLDILESQGGDWSEWSEVIWHG